MPKSSYDTYMEVLKEQRAPAEAAGARLIEQERYEEAEQTITAVDNSIYGMVAIARLYRLRLEQIVASPELRRDRTRMLAVFRKALRWAQSSYPEPHTEYEGESIVRGQASDRAELVQVIGYDPDADS